MTPEDVTGFFEERDARPDCPICSKNKWAVLGMDGEEVVSLKVQWAEKAERHGQHVPAMMMVCNHCGFIRLHHHTLIQDELTKQRGDTDDS